ncbi:MAG: hypothetical protein J0J11_00635, partial [Microbacterium sp.]|nr:hypothetical protein [Microbacterium sp.]
ALMTKQKINDGWSLERIAWALIQQHRDAEALPALQRAAELQQPWSQFVLGKTIYDGCPELNIKRDEKAGLVWIQRSARLCHPEAVHFLADHDLPGECASSDPYEYIWRRLAKWWSRRGGFAVGSTAVVVLLLTLLKIRRKPSKEGRP